MVVFRWWPALISLGYRLAQVMAKYTFSKSLKVCLPLPIGQPKQFTPPSLFFKQTSYLIPLLAIISKSVLCHHIFQLDQFHIFLGECHTPTISWVSSKFKFIYNDKVHVPPKVASLLYI